jgi:hypothetical protein
MKKYILAGMIILGTVFSGHTQTKEEEILKLLELTNVRNLAEQIFEMYIPQIQVLVPSVPKEFWDMFKEKMDFDSFVKAYIPLYDRYYTLEEIKAMIAFYESPTGRRVIEVTPLLTAESMSLGQEWGLRMGELILEEMKRTGYLDI